MARTRPPSHLTAEHPEWVFTWRPLGSPLFPKVFAIAVTAAGFAFLLGSVRVGFRTPDRWAPNHGSVIHVGDDPAGLALARRARDGGPFPSRFEPAGMAEIQAMENEAFDALRWTPPAYRPELRPLPPSGLEGRREPLANRGVRVFPELPAAPRAGVATAVEIAPVLDPLAGITRDDLPETLPPFDGIDGKLTAETLLFLTRLRADGSVIDCVALAGGDKDNEDHLQRLGTWLRSLRFAPAKPEDPAVRWASVGIRFVNQPASDGPQPE